MSSSYDVSPVISVVPPRKRSLFYAPRKKRISRRESQLFREANNDIPKGFVMNRQFTHGYVNKDDTRLTERKEQARRDRLVRIQDLKKNLRSIVDDINALLEEEELDINEDTNYPLYREGAFIQ